MNESNDILNLLQETFPKCWFKSGHEWDGTGDAAVWSGEDSTIEGEGGEMEAFDSNAWEHDPNEEEYTMGVHKDLDTFVTERGYRWEAYDSGTYLLYKN